jgi:hypothetical protein
MSRSALLMKITTILVVKMIISPKFLICNEQNDNRPLTKRYVVAATDIPSLSILKKALYMLRCLQHGESERTIIQKFYPSCHHLVRMWINILLYDRRVSTSKDVGITYSSSEYWTIMTKGREWLNKIKRTNNDVSSPLQYGVR